MWGGEIPGKVLLGFSGGLLRGLGVLCLWVQSSQTEERELRLGEGSTAKESALPLLHGS